MIKLFILLANIGLPILILYLQHMKHAGLLGWLFLFFMTSHVCIRMWETFFTSKEKSPQKFEGDWTLVIGTLAYIVMLYLVSIEFLMKNNEQNFVVTICGIVSYAIGTRLRWWGALTLGKQWAVHVVGESKVDKRRLLRIGPYAYIRHPIYLGIALDEISIPLIANSYLTLWFVLLINLPLLVARLLLEEKRSKLNFQNLNYQDYKKNTGAFWPKFDCWRFVLKFFGLKRD